MNDAPARRFRARAVLIDLDGTLLDTIDDLAAAANAMLVELGVGARPVADVRRFVGKGAESLVQRALTGSLDAPIDASRLAQALPVFRRHYARENGVSARCYPGSSRGSPPCAPWGWNLPASRTNRSHSRCRFSSARALLAGSTS